MHLRSSGFVPALLCALAVSAQQPKPPKPEAVPPSGRTAPAGSHAGAEPQPAAGGFDFGGAPAVETVYDGGLQAGWQDLGWAPRTLGTGKPVSVDLSGASGWIVSKPRFDAAGALGLRFLYRLAAGAPPALEVRVDSTRAETFPRVALQPRHQRALEGGWIQVFVSLSELSPKGGRFDRIVFRNLAPAAGTRVELDRIAWVGATEAASRASLLQSLSADAPPHTFAVECRGSRHPISPLIYGIAYALAEKKVFSPEESHQWELGATARRWGGNHTSRYNWELGNAWNTGRDWFFMNVNYTGLREFSADDFLDEDLEHGITSALTVPMMGWAAKDTRSYSFPVKKFGPQEAVAPENTDAGNGRDKNGVPLKPGNPAATSLAVLPQAVGRWVQAIRKRDQQRGRSVAMYILDNEPMLWNDTHRDVHPEPTTYDELLSKTIATAAEIRKADPEGTIAGPAEWGWPAFFYSALDAQVSFTLHPDRLQHGNTPLLPWYLGKLREYARKNGKDLLDVVDVHFYPQAKGLGLGTQGGTDPATAALRLRQTRGLWDPTYVDESYVGEPVRLLPRLKEWIAQSYPGRGISIGEWNYGAEGHLSGGLAVAETLGRFAQAGVTSAFYWDYPARSSPAFWAFRAFRNFDGKGGRFQDESVDTSGSDGSASLFASSNAARTRMTLVLLNLSPSTASSARIALNGCGEAVARRTFIYAGGPDGYTEVPSAPASGEVRQTLPPWSITVLDLSVKRK